MLFMGLAAENGEIFIINEDKQIYLKRVWSSVDLTIKSYEILIK